MGLIGQIFGTAAGTQAVGKAAETVAEVFVPNATKKMLAAEEAYKAAIDEQGAEFQYAAPGLFDRFINGLNRMPRPMLAFGTIGLFVYAMIDRRELRSSEDDSIDDFRAVFDFDEAFGALSLT